MLPPTTFQTANLSIPDTFVLMVLALVVFGPRRLPEIGRQVGKLLYEFRKASNDFKLQMEEELRVAEENDRLKKQQVIQAETPVLTAGNEVLPVATAGETVVDAAPVKEWTGEEYNTYTPTEEIASETVAESVANPAEPADPKVEPAMARPAAEPATDSAAEHVVAAAVPVIQPPGEGETVSAARPDYRANLIAEGEKTAIDRYVPEGKKLAEEAASAEAGSHHD
jgi:sec-independent protein translocase protein TatB